MLRQTRLSFVIACAVFFITVLPCFYLFFTIDSKVPFNDVNAFCPVLFFVFFVLAICANYYLLMQEKEKEKKE